MKKGKYASMTDDDFERLLCDQINGLSASDLLFISGIYEALSEHFNNDVLDAWEEEQAENEIT